MERKMTHVRAGLLIVVALAACSGGGPVVVRAVSGRTGVPVAGIQVQVDGQPWTTTGADGKATFAAAPRPFTVFLHQSRPLGDLPAVESVIVLRGRTESEVMAEVDGSPWRSTGITGTVTGRSGPPSSLVRVGLDYKEPTIGAAIGAFSVAGGDGSFGSDIRWEGKSSEPVVLRAFESDAANPPSHYFGFGSASASVSESDLTTGVRLSLQPVPEGAVEGAVTLPSALVSSDNPTLALWLDFAPYDRLLLTSNFTPAGKFSLVAPSVAGAQTWIGVAARGQGGFAWQERRVDVPSGGLALDLATPPELVEPTAGAPIGAVTVFRWSPGVPGGSYSLSLSCKSTPAGDHFVTYDLEAEGLDATLPAIPGVALVPGSDCDWTVLWCAATDPAKEKSCSFSTSRTAVAM
jgi:hypothetical protein